MDVNNQDLSLSLYSYLCKVVGSEDVVRTRRRLLNAYGNVYHTRGFTRIISGSKGEGLDLGGSDNDNLFAFYRFSVYENIEELSIHSQNKHMKIPIIMDTSDTKPGYTRLKMYYKDNDVWDMFCYETGNETFLSSKLLRETWISDVFTVHGPCHSDPNNQFDAVFGFHCAKWILQADKWKYRSRSAWPHNRLIQRIVKYGVLFVPAGFKNSPREDLEFRISFNIAEKLLVHSFSHVQLLCYALLKNILNHFIKPQYGDLLCSYFLKTVMFWTSEESLESIWKPNNLLRCFDLCFKRFVYCVTYNTCLHYFIPELDLFEDRFSKFEHDSLTSTLESLYESGWQCVLRTSLFRSFSFVNDLSTGRIVPSASAFPSMCLTGVWSFTADSVILLRLIRIVYGSLSIPGKEMYTIILSQAMQNAAQFIPMNTTAHDTNKQIYRNYRNCLNHLLQGIHHDALSGWLLVTSFFYTRKQYKQCLRVLNYCLHQCTPDKILLGINIDPKLEQEFSIEMQQHLKIDFQRTCKLRVVDIVNFSKNSCIIPEELSGLVVNQGTSLPPVVFAHCLRCICLHRLNRNRDKMNALRHLETTVKELYFIRPTERHIDVSFNVLYLTAALLLRAE